jgi:hypothetical protein
MLHKEIKNVQQAKKVAKELAKDLNQEIGFFGWYEVLEEEQATCFTVQVVSSLEAYCSDLTEYVIERVYNVWGVYSRIYDGVSLVFTTIRRDDGEYIPAIEFKIRWANN